MSRINSSESKPQRILDFGRLEQILPEASEILRTPLDLLSLNQSLDESSRFDRWLYRGAAGLAIKLTHQYIYELIAEKTEATIEELLENVIKREKERLDSRLLQAIVWELLDQAFKLWEKKARGTPALAKLEIDLVSVQQDLNKEAKYPQYSFQSVAGYLHYKLVNELQEQTLSAARGPTTQ